MSFREYPKYLATPTEWFERIPLVWGVGRLGYECETIVPMRDKPASLNGDIPWVRIEDFDGKFIGQSKSNQGVGYDIVQEMNLKVLPVGTVLCSCSCSMGATAIVTNPLVTNQTFIGIVPGPNYYPDYLYYLFGAATDYLNSIGTGAIQTYLSRDDFRQLRLPKPPLSEQEGISRFLDRETAKIDALVAEQEQLITLLKEKRQAVISHAVTKGLDPSVPMKDSGVEWLGEVPTHWGVSALSYLSSIETGATPDRGDPSYWNGKIPWLKTGEINWAPIRDAEEFITEDGLANSAAKLSQPGTLLMAMYGQGVTRGRVALLEIEATYNQACAAITFGDRVMPEFGRYFFMAAYDHIREGGNETSQMNLSAGLIAKFRLTVPPKVEQSAIVQMLDVELSRLDVLCDEAENAVRILQERRSALIIAAVTGQIDVRGLSPAQEQAA